MRQGRHLGAEEDVFNELTNEAYRISKGMSSMTGVSTWIMWKLIEYTKIPGMIDQREKDEAWDVPTDEICAKKEECQRLVGAIAKLSDEEIKMIYFYYRDGMGYTGIGRKMGFSRTWIKKKIEHALRKIRKEMMG